MLTNVFVEARPKGKLEGSPVTDYVVESAGGNMLLEAATQQEAIDWAKTNGYTPHVARVRNLNDKLTPFHWRAV